MHRLDERGGARGRVQAAPQAVQGSRCGAGSQLGRDLYEGATADAQAVPDSDRVENTGALVVRGL